ncbi:MAG: YggT family protein [Clostridiales bacterium]|nr:YggT family protein [Clostridiales bacterium]
MNIAIATAVQWFGQILFWLMFARAIMSWIPSLRESFISNFLAAVTEPFISPVRKLVAKSPLSGGVLDFSFLITMILLQLVVIPLLTRLALMLPI